MEKKKKIINKYLQYARPCFFSSEFLYKYHRRWTDFVHHRRLYTHRKYFLSLFTRKQFLCKYLFYFFPKKFFPQYYPQFTLSNYSVNINHYLSAVFMDYKKNVTTRTRTADMYRIIRILTI